MSGIYSDDKHGLGAELREEIGYPIGPTMTPYGSLYLDKIMDALIAQGYSPETIRDGMEQGYEDARSLSVIPCSRDR